MERRGDPNREVFACFTKPIDRNVEGDMHHRFGAHPRFETGEEPCSRWSKGTINISEKEMLSKRGWWGG